MEIFEVVIAVIGVIVLPLTGYAVNYLNTELKNLNEGHCDQEVRIAVIETKIEDDRKEKEHSKKCDCKDKKKKSN